MRRLRFVAITKVLTSVASSSIATLFPCNPTITLGGEPDGATVLRFRHGP